jgi:diguanylate cyclase (GGDEF)-like protein
VDERQLSAVLSEFAYTLTADVPTTSILVHLVQRIVSVLPVTSAGVTLIVPGGQPHYVAASDDDAMRFEKLQTDLDEGPCVLAFESGTLVSVPWLGAESRFPRFAPAALEAGLQAVFTFPLRHGPRRLGALDLYRDSPGELDPLDLEAAQTLANVATAYLLNARAHEDAHSNSDRLRHIATHDALTGLPNRRLLMQRIEHARARALRSHTAAGVLFADLDRFKLVNDTHGHQVGDLLLQAVAARLDRLVRPGDTLARIYGDEFVLLCEDVRDRSDVAVLAERVRQAFGEPFRIGDLTLTVSASVGVAFAGPGEEVSEHLVSEADQAMYDAKRAHETRDAHRPHLSAAPATDEIVDDLADAIERERMQLGYQPVVTCADSALVGLEALLRWTAGGSVPVPPASVVEFAERTGLIRQLGSFVIDVGCREAARWRAAHPELPVRLDVSLSTYQLRSPHFVSDVQETLERTGLAPGDLLLGISGTVVAQDTELARWVLSDLRRLGVTVALDDFGTGCCSLDDLRRLSLDLVKIDLAVVGDEDGGQPLLPPLVDLGHALDVTVLVEGVATEAQRDAVMAAGADQARGSFFAPPMSVAAVDLLLDGRASDASGRVRLPLGV